MGVHKVLLYTVKMALLPSSQANGSSQPVNAAAAATMPRMNVAFFTRMGFGFAAKVVE
jgi:hypothetical protein